MGIYIAIFVFAIVAYLWGINHKKGYIILMGTIFFLLIGLRDLSIGTDTKNYLDLYNNSREHILNTASHFPSVAFFTDDTLFFATCALFKNLGVPYRGLLLFASATEIICTFSLIKRYSKEYMISVTTFMTVGLMATFMSATRQSLAIAIVSVAIKYMVEKKPVKYTLLIILAAGFHITALVMIPIYILVEIIRNRRPLFILILSVALGIVFSGAFYLFLNSIDVGIRFSDYLEKGTGTNPLVMVMYIAIAIVYILFRYSDISIPEDEIQIGNVIFSLVSVGIGIIAISLRNTMVSRLSYYCMVGLPILLGNSIDFLKDVRVRIYSILLCLGIEFIYLVFVLSNPTFNIVNYFG